MGDSIDYIIIIIIIYYDKMAKSGVQESDVIRTTYERSNERTSDRSTTIVVVNIIKSEPILSGKS